MIELYEECKLAIFLLLLIVCSVITVWSYVSYRKRKYTQLLITYGYLLLTISVAITVVKIIIGMDRKFIPIAVPFGIIGFILVIIGNKNERRKNNNSVQ
jgi:ABC-type iron transport system FetAB permease component